MRAKTLSSIPIAEVSTWVGRAPAGNDAETWKVGLVGKDKEAYIKLTNDTVITVSELASAQVGKALGLKIPQAYLVRVDINEIPKPSAIKGQGEIYCFASQTCSRAPVTLEHLLRSPITTNANWTERQTTLVFDEWIANVDRHQGNIVFDPDSKHFWLIDHGRALTGMPPAFIDLTNPAVSCHNQLLQEDKLIVDEKYAKHIQHQSNQLMLECKKINMNSLDIDDHFAKISSALTKEQVREFLAKRIHETTKLICQKIGQPMLNLNPT